MKLTFEREWGKRSALTLDATAGADNTNKTNSAVGSC
jgi:hypothetical protein